MIKKFLCIAGLALLAMPSARAFSLAGPPGNAGDAWQTAVIGYPGLPASAPKNLGEGYRLNVPVLYYAYTPAFLDYFGTAGETNIDFAFTNILNGALAGGVTNYSAGLTEVPLDSAQLNYTAAALQLLDLKSYFLGMIMVNLGLDDPEGDTWRLHARYLPSGGTCPIDEEYTVIQRNYAISPTDYTQIQYSSYVNDTLYSFYLFEDCTGVNPLAFTEPFPVDPLADPFTSVAGSVNFAPEGVIFYGLGLQYGQFFTSLTSDDIAGFRYLLSPSNVNWETVEGGSLLLDESTNFSAGEVQFPANANTPQGFGTYNLASLLSFSSTNPPAAIQAAFPGVVVSSSTSYFVLASNATYSVVLIPPPIGSIYGTLPTVGLATNYTFYLATNYVTKFANVFPVTTNHYSTNILMTVTTGPKIGATYGTIGTTTNYQTVINTNLPSGDFYAVNNFGTNLCGSGIQSLGLTTTVYTTNLVVSGTTNLVTATNTSTYSVAQYVISSYVSHDYIAYPVNCAQTAQATGLYRGINKVQFVRVDYDSLLGQVIQPFTNSFTMVAVTNGQDRVEHFDRAVTVPDITLDAADFAADKTFDGVTISGIGELPAFQYAPEFDQANILPGLAGPGTIGLTQTVGAPNTPMRFIFDKVGDIFENGFFLSTTTATNSFFLGQTTQVQLLAFGSFDGTTNAPVVYPDGSSIADLQGELEVSISPSASQVQLNLGKVNTPYLDSGTNLTFSVTGGGGAYDLTDPYSWTTTAPPIVGGTAANSGLPPGLTLNSATGVLSGTPTLAGTYDFTLIFTDYYSKSVQWSYTIIIQ